jgi:hypothetical protein
MPSPQIALLPLLRRSRPEAENDQVTNHAAAVEAVRGRWLQRRAAWMRGSENADPTVEEAWQANDDCATLLRAYEAVVAERNFIAASRDLVQAGVNLVKDHANQLTALRAQHAAAEAVLDAALAWEKVFNSPGEIDGLTPVEDALSNAIRAYRAAKEGT